MFFEGGIVFLNGTDGLEYKLKYGMTNGFEVSPFSITLIFLQVEASTDKLFNDYPFLGKYDSETEKSTIQKDLCYQNQFGIYFHSHDQTTTAAPAPDLAADPEMPDINLPTPGSDWFRFCIETKYRTYSILQQMIDFAFIGE